MSIEVDVANAVVDELNNNAFSIEFEAERIATRDEKELKDIKKDVLVEVMSQGLFCSLEGELAARKGMGRQVTVDIFVRKKMGQPEQDVQSGKIPTSELDDFKTFVEEIAFRFDPSQPNSTGVLTTYPKARCKSIQLPSGYVTDKFIQTRVFMGQIRLEFAVAR